MNEDQYEKDKIKRYYDEHLSLYEDLTKEVKFILEKNFKKENIKAVNIAKRVKIFERKTKIEVRLENETVWLTQKLMAELFQVTIPTINEHVKNICNEAELVPEATIRKFRIVQKERKSEGQCTEIILLLGG